MNIQQALNQSLISGATSAYLTGDILERGKQSAIDKYKSSSEEVIESERQDAIAHGILEDVHNELDKAAKDGHTSDEVMENLVNESINSGTNARLAEERGNLASKNFNRATRNLEKWVLDNDEAYSYETMHKMKQLNMRVNLWDDIQKARVEAKALRSLTQQQETATNTTQELNKRIDGLRSGTYKSRMHQPSVRMEE